MKKQFLTMGLILGVLFLPLTATAQEAEGMTTEETEADGFTFGSVVNITPTNVTIEEYDYDSDEIIKVAYAIDSKTQFINCESSEDITEGNNITIDYTGSAEGEKTALVISKEKSWDDETGVSNGDNEEEEYQENGSPEDEYMSEPEDATRG